MSAPLGIFRRFSLLLSFVVLSSSVLSANAQAAMVSTSEFSAQSLEVRRAAISTLLRQPDAVSLLQSMGVTLQDAQRRVQTMTADELTQLESSTDLPAGQGVGFFGIIVIAAVIAAFIGGFFLVKSHESD